MQRVIYLTAIVLLLTNGGDAQEVAKAQAVLPIWPGAAPTWTAPTEPERDTSTSKSNKVADKKVIRLANVTKPELHLFPASGDKASETTIVIAPGGGYNILAWDLEGTEIAQWLNDQGITAFLCKYRVPRREGLAKHAVALEDAQQAIKLIRTRAKEFGVIPD